MALKPAAAARKDALGAKHPATMQHRHFAVIAGIILDMPGLTARPLVARHFADRLAGTNENFDRARFLKACGII